MTAAVCADDPVDRPHSTAANPRLVVVEGPSVGKLVTSADAGARDLEKRLHEWARGAGRTAGLCRGYLAMRDTRNPNSGDSRFFARGLGARLPLPLLSPPPPLLPPQPLA